MGYTDHLRSSKHKLVRCLYLSPLTLIPSPITTSHSTEKLFSHNPNTHHILTPLLAAIREQLGDSHTFDFPEGEYDIPAPKGTLSFVFPPVLPLPVPLLYPLFPLSPPLPPSPPLSLYPLPSSLSLSTPSPQTFHFFLPTNASYRNFRPFLPALLPGSSRVLILDSREFGSGWVVPCLDVYA